MNFLLERWRRGFVHRYFAELDPTDRATALIVLALLSAFLLCCSAIGRHRAASADFAPPRLTAPPFIMDFAAVGVPP